MAELFGRSMTRHEISRHVGDISQVCDAKRSILQGGRADGVEVVDFRTGSGFDFSVVPSRGLDISRASFRGTPISWTSSPGITHPTFYDSDGYEWLRGFFGGLLTTCGMTYASHPCEDDGESLGLHGRVANIPAEDVAVTKKWDGDEYKIAVSGLVRETKVFGHKLDMHRTISTSLGARSLTISDTIENTGFKKCPLMMLYHINIGWPIVSENSHLVASSRSIIPADERAEREPEGWLTFTEPQADYAERVYFHDLASDEKGIVRAALINDERNIGVGLTFPKHEFPHFVQWKMMGQGEYVVGIEPGNITGHRAKMREDGSLEFIEPGAVRRFNIQISVLDGPGDIASFTSAIETA